MRCLSLTGSMNVASLPLVASLSGALSLDSSRMFFWYLSSFLLLVEFFGCPLFLRQSESEDVLHPHTTQVVNSSANLFIYCAIGARYFTYYVIAMHFVKIYLLICYDAITRFRAQCWKHFFCRGDGVACQCTQTSAEVIKSFCE